MTDEDYKGLHPDTEGVVQFWWGKRSGGMWGIDPASVEEAQRVCAELNAESKSRGR
jgi:hypothetical protein